MTIKVTVPNSSGDYLTFGSGNTPTAAQIGGYDDGSSNGHMEFYTTASGTSTERMRIDSSGNVMVGASSNGGGKFEVKQSATTQQGIWIYSPSTDSNGRFYCDNSVVGIAASYSSTGSYLPITFTTSATERARIDSSGNLLVGTTSQPYSGNSVAGVSIERGTSIGLIRVAKTYSGNADGQMYFYNGTYLGGITYNNSAVAYNTTSDYRLKENVQPMVGALEKVAALKPVTYTWKTDGSNGEGFIAHELQEVCPQAVTWEKDAVEEDGTPKYQGIDTSFLVATLTAAIQEQQAIITSLTERITALENK